MPNTSSTLPTVRATAWLAIALCGSFFVGWFAMLAMSASGYPVDESLWSVGASYSLTLEGNVHGDSWTPMLLAYQRDLATPDTPMYRLFFEDRIKFQYPPSSLLVLDLLPHHVVEPYVPGPLESPSQLVELWMTWPSRIATFVVIGVSVSLMELGLRRVEGEHGTETGGRLARVLLATTLGLCYYPLLKGYDNGQIQIFINAAIALALLCTMTGRSIVASVLLGMCCLIKPQYAIVALLPLAWRDLRFFVGFAVTASVGFVVSLARFGVADHLQYLEVLRLISRRGETYWPNQSLNGLLNRLLENGSATEFYHYEFPLHEPGVYYPALAFGLALMVLALWKGTHLAKGVAGDASRSMAAVAAGDVRYARTVNLGCVLLAATLASPVAWEHHYGWVLALFAVAMPQLLAQGRRARVVGATFGVSFLCVCNALLIPDELFQNRWLGLLGSHLYFGSLMLFGLLMLKRAPLYASASAFDVPANGMRLEGPPLATL
jgi:alpha-1,2-mannosyltransferase